MEESGRCLAFTPREQYVYTFLGFSIGVFGQVGGNLKFFSGNGGMVIEWL